MTGKIKIVTYKKLEGLYCGKKLIIAENKNERTKTTWNIRNSIYFLKSYCTKCTRLFI
jgi:hypothetical protein